ncbi:MAG TPA: hypothetical protein VKA84_29230 [Gemmatimonadaceae bacterium]|nr:hypothetical protein [Gemmatimonadaceae bacterium]
MTAPALLLALSLAANRPADSWWGPDKIKHFFMSAFVQSVSYSALRLTRLDRGPSIAGATVVTAAVGVGRELHDRRTKGLFSVPDLAWDAAGAGAASLVLSRTQ